MNYFPLTLGFEGVDSNWFKVIFSCQTLCTNNPDLLQISLKLEWNISIKIKSGGKSSCYLHQDVDSTINATWNLLLIARNFAKSQKISNRKTPLLCNCPLSIASTISKVHLSGMCILQRPTFEVFTWALVLQITVPHWQSHLWLASCETLLWLPALEEGTLVYIWPPRLLSTSTSGRAGREGRAQVFAIKEIRGRDLGHHATPAPNSVLSPY